MTLAFDIMLPVTIIVTIPMARNIYRGTRTWAKTRVAIGTKYLEARDDFKTKNAEKERLKQEKESNKSS